MIFIGNFQDPRRAKTNLLNAKDLVGFRLHEFTKDDKGKVIKTVWYWPRSTCIDNGIGLKGHK